MTCTISLAGLIGGLSAFFVALTAAVVLGLSLGVGLSTIDENALRSVEALGRAGVQQADRFFSVPTEHTRRIARLPGVTRPPLQMPLSDPTANLSRAEAAAAGIPWGGITTRRYIEMMQTFMIQSNFAYAAIEARFLDGVRHMLFNLPDSVPTSKYCVQEIGLPKPDATDYWLDIDHEIINKETASVANLHTDVFAGILYSKFKTSLYLTSPHKPAYRAEMLAKMDRLPQDGTPLWTQPMFIVGDGDVPAFMMSAAAVITDNTGAKPQGATSVILSIDRLGPDVLDKLKLTPDSAAFVVDINGFITGASSGVEAFTIELYTADSVVLPQCSTTNQSHAVYKSTGLPKMACRHSIKSSPYEALTLAVAADPDMFDMSTLNGSDVRVKQDRGSFTFVSGIPTFQDSHLKLALVLSVPEAGILGNAAKLIALTTSITVAVVILVGAMSCTLVWAVLQPLKGIARRMAAASRLEDDDDDGSLSPLSELAALQITFAAMAAELNRIRAFVPQSLLRAASTDDDEFDEEDIMSNGKSGVSSDCSGLVRIGFQSSAHSGGVVRTSGLSSARSSRSHHYCEPSVTGSTVTKESGAVRSRIVEGTRKENVTVLAANFLGFHTAISKGIDMVKMANVVETVLDFATAQKGVIEAFHGDRFLISFNAVRPAAVHGTRAAILTVRLNSKLPTQGYGLRMSAGVATGGAVVGNLGSASLRRFSIIGAVVPQALALERICKWFPGSACLVPERLVSDLNTAVTTTFVDFILLPQAKTPCLIAAVLRELDACDQGANDEWMYQIAAQHSGQGADAAVVKLDSRWRAAVGGNMSGALDGFSEWLATTPTAPLEAISRENFVQRTASGVMIQRTLGEFYDLLNGTAQSQD